MLEKDLLNKLKEIFKEIDFVTPLLYRDVLPHLWLFNCATFEMEWIYIESFQIGMTDDEANEIKNNWRNSISAKGYSTFIDHIKECIKHGDESCSLALLLDHRHGGQEEKIIYEGLATGRDVANGQDYILGLQRPISRPDMLAKFVRSNVIQDFYFKHTDAALYLLDVQGNFLSIPGRPRNEMDLFPYQEVLGKNLKELFPKEITNPFFNSINRLKVGDSKGSGFNYKLKIDQLERSFHADLYQIDNDQILLAVRDQTKEDVKTELSRRKAELQKCLLAISNRLLHYADDMDFELMINTVLAQLGEAVDCDRVYVFEYNFREGVTSNTYEWCAEGISSELENLQNVSLSNVDQSWLEAHKRGDSYEILAVDHLPDSDMLKSILMEQGIKSLVTVPIGRNDELKGFVGFDWVTHYFIPFEDQIQVLAIFADLFHATLNKQIRASEKQIENLFSRQLIAEIHTPFVRVDMDGKVEQVNQAFCHLVKLDRKQIIGQTIPYSWWPNDEKNQILELFQEVYDRDSYEVEVNFIDANERRFPVLISGKKFQQESEMVIRYSTIVDLSLNQGLTEDLQETKNWLSISQQAARLAHFVLDLDTGKIEASDQFQKLLGVDNAEIEHIENVLPIIPNFKFPKYKALFDEFIEKRQPVDMVVEVIRPLDNKLVFVNIQGIINYSRTGTALELQGTLRDVSEERRYLLEIERQNKRLKEIAWLQSHELRSPLVRIMSLLNAVELADESDQSSMKNLLSDIYNSSSDMDSIITEIVRRAENYGLDELIKSTEEFYGFYKLVIVDDDELIRTLTVNIVKAVVGNVEVLSLDDGKSLKDFIETQYVNWSDNERFLVLLDINMPGMNGWETLKYIEVQGLGDRMNVVMFTSSVSMLDKRKALSYPFVSDFIEKPLKKSVLKKLLSSYRIN